MDSVDIEVLRWAEAWRKGGHRVALGTIVKTWGSAPRPVGAMVAWGLVKAPASGVARISSTFSRMPRRWKK